MSAQKRKRSEVSSGKQTVLAPVENEAPHRPGAIVRIRMLNFMIYTENEIYPESRLNVIIGANGSGKSSIICAICLCLGGKPEQLARTTDGKQMKLGEYVKKGSEKAEIEVELYKPYRYHGVCDGHTNVRIMRRFNLENHSKWYINDKEVTQNEILNVMLKWNIQVGNLCSFLSQERVAAFAQMKSTELLVETIKAADPNLYKQQEKLIELRKVEKEHDMKKLDLEKELATKRSQQEERKAALDRYHEKQEREQRLNICQKRLPWAIYEATKPAAMKARKEKEELEHQLNEEKKKHAPLEEAIKSAQSEYARYQSHEKRALMGYNKINDERNKLMHMLHELTQKVTDKQDEWQATEDEKASYQQKLAKQEELIRTTQNLLNALPTEEELSEKLREINHETTRIRDAQQAYQDRIAEARADQPRIRSQLMRWESEKKRLENTQTLRLERADRVKQGVKKEYEIVQKLKSTLKGQVWGPIFNEITVTDDMHAQFIENAIVGEWPYAYVVEEQDDWSTLSNAGIRLVICNATSPSSHIPRQVDDTLLDEYGITWLDQLITCPDKVMKVLMDFCKIHTTAVSTHPLSASAMEAVLSQRKGDQRLTSLMTPDLMTKVQFSLYGGGVSSSVNALRPARIFAKLDLSQQQRIEEEIQACKQQLREIEDVVAELQRDAPNYQKQMEVIEQKRKSCQQYKSDRGRYTRQLETARENKLLLEQEQNVEARQAAIMKKIEQLNNQRFDKMQMIRERVVPLLLQATMAHDAAMLNTVQAKCRLDHLIGEQKQANHTLSQLQSKVEAAVAEFQRRLAICKAEKSKAVKELSEDAHNAMMQDENNKWLFDMNIDALQIEIEMLKSQIEQMIGDASIQHEYAQREQEIADLDARTTEIIALHEEKKAELEKIKRTWLPAVEQMVEKVNVVFQRYFRRVRCEGSVQLLPHDDFEKYELHLKVSFREGVAAQRLSSFKQSGGEKSLSTMLYLLSLQVITDCPFRVVDEINQGMDHVNERLIFEQIVESTQSKTTPQYFLVTPKLLPNLEFSASINFLIVYNGPWACAQDEWDVDEILQTMKKHRHLPPAPGEIRPMAVVH